jgi:hypothetical protein
MAKECFCGCGRKVRWGRKRISNALGAQFDKDLRLFRGAADDPAQAEHAAELADLVATGEPIRDALRDLVHGTITRDQFDRAAGRAWIKRASDMRGRVVRQVLDEDYAGWNAHAQAQLVHGGRRAPAVLLEVEDTGTTVNHDPRVRLRLRVEPEGEPPFELERKLLVSRVAVPRAGERVEVFYDPEDPERFTFRLADLTDDAPAPDRVELLERLARLHADGALTDDEFRAEKARILGSAP